MSKGILSPLAPLFALTNFVAFFGWSFVLFQLVSSFSASYPEPPLANELLADVQSALLVLEGICAIEVFRMFLGDLPGNLILGVVLHSIRVVTILEVLPHVPLATGILNHWTASAVLASWAVTEVTRYPMYMFHKSTLCRSVRLVVPLLTFPIGAFSEAFGAYIVLGDTETTGWLRIVLVAVVFINAFLGPTLAYPALLRKGLPVLGLSKKKEKKPTIKSV
mmetsp:Transcript_33377/g.49120  ORF Transcript_33377/g.49120 Transcript_33377/m.49120 type:complete len:221 (+) Transcript_33377:150-812(+)|eukprot:CAMPEP_0195517102 /NCGR_PEP_ID=MMETSP0794_2-20130614/9701_1 /TAXON_ID=515487 /ORGANISM="Stephanopyxis turris, Strain CCMP 815" /LENGTH=220 /DNA_ID=CAMNT_0040645853 /DNA_START=36 /DNA_END=698 /DNA_ORIENTATION=-